MKSYLITCFLFTALLSHGANGQSIDKSALTKNAMTVNELINIIDSYRGLGSKGFSFDITNVSYKANREPRQNKLRVDVKQNDSIIKFLSPARQQGRVLLKQQNNMWLYIPGTRNVIRISPAQRLLGEASNADVTGSNFSSDYTGEIIEGTNSDIQVLLTAKENNTSYHKVKFWLQNKAPYQPIKSEYFSRSGKRLKIAQYKAFKMVDGALKVHKMLLSDPLIEGSYTWMLFDNYHLNELPSALFNKEAITNL